jgi:hypothetical protein
MSTITLPGSEEFTDRTSHTALSHTLLTPLVNDTFGLSLGKTILEEELLQMLSNFFRILPSELKKVKKEAWMEYVPLSDERLNDAKKVLVETLIQDSDMRQRAFVAIATAANPELDERRSLTR